MKNPLTLPVLNWSATLELLSIVSMSKKPRSKENRLLSGLLSLALLRAAWSVNDVTVVRDDPESLTGGDSPSVGILGADFGVSDSFWSLCVVGGLVMVEVSVEDESVTTETAVAVEEITVAVVVIPVTWGIGEI